MAERLSDTELDDWLFAEASDAQHASGTCRMGADPAASVVNKFNQSWDAPNLFIVDGSVVATGGMVNPTPTISALALRAATHIRDRFRELAGSTRPLAA